MGRAAIAPDFQTLMRHPFVDCLLLISFDMNIVREKLFADVLTDLWIGGGSTLTSFAHLCWAVVGIIVCFL